ncbi:hypothetical protein ACRAWF_42485 [Streptomyces sp. L7]
MADVLSHRAWSTRVPVARLRAARSGGAVVVVMETVTARLPSELTAGRVLTPAPSPSWV